MSMVEVSLEEVKEIKWLGIVSGYVHYLSNAANISRLFCLLLISLVLCIARYAVVLLVFFML